MRLGLVGKKIGMTQKFYESGEAVPVTVLQVEPGKIVEVIEKDKRGYSALLVGYGHIKSSKLTKSMKGFYAKKSLEAKKFLKEYRVENTEEFKAGSDITLDILKDKKYVDIRSKTIGKGFAGVMKRWNFGGLRATHGVSVSHRSHGSTGQRQDPGKVFKGKKMAGHMGAANVTVQNLEVIKTMSDEGYIYIKGAVPGPKGGWVLLKDSVKKSLPDNLPLPAGLKSVSDEVVNDKSPTENVEHDQMVDAPEASNENPEVSNSEGDSNES